MNKMTQKDISKLNDETDWIDVRGARTHNLKNISLRIPKNSISVIVGPSGAGKSSLAIDTLYAEGSRRYLESLNLSSRQQFSQWAHAEVDQIIGLSPSVELKSLRAAPGIRSSVGTLTEIDSLLRTLFYKGSEVHCPHCDRHLKAWTVAEIVDEILKSKEGSPAYILAPVSSLNKEQCLTQGILRYFHLGQVQLIEDLEGDLVDLDDISLVVDRFKIQEKHRNRIWEAVEAALKFSTDGVGINISGDSNFFPLNNRCPEHDFSLSIESKKAFSFNSRNACPTCKGIGELDSDNIQRGVLCKDCQGRRLKAELLQVKYRDRDLAELSMMSLSQLQKWISSLSHLKQWEASIFSEIEMRIDILINIGLPYLHLYRSIPSLSSGEFQRVRIATQIGSRMSGVCYFLDEPLSGLHIQDQMNLWQQLIALRDQGNTLVLVEHSRYAISQADFMVELGPGSGVEGGELLYSGIDWNTTQTHGYEVYKQSLNQSIEALENFQNQPFTNSIEFNIPNYYTIEKGKINLDWGRLQVIAGVSGSGKSTLMIDLIYPFLKEKFQTILIDSTPLRGGRRSSPASLTGIMDQLRQLFAKLPESKVRGYHAARFSLNKKGGRCEHCLGEGVHRVELDFSGSSLEECEYCHGSGFNQPTLEVLFKGHSIAQVLDMEVSYAHRFFRDHPKIFNVLDILMECGLSHLRLGVSANQLSQGEMQRLKLARDLKTLPRESKAWILLDEPSRGLFFQEVKQVMSYLNQLKSAGHGILVVDHHPDVIAQAEHLHLMGPGSGVQGGQLIESEKFQSELLSWLQSI